MAAPSPTLPQAQSEQQEDGKKAAVSELQDKLQQLGVNIDGCADLNDLRKMLREKLLQREWPFSVQRLSERTLVIVENDKYGEAPHIYIVRGKSKAVIIDTGCDTADLREFLWTLPELDGLQFQVVNTHVHYDHIMGNACFCCAGGQSLRRDCLCICQGARDRRFSENWVENSLQTMFCAGPIKSFCVTQWLQEGDKIYLDDAQPSEAESLEVIYTPGHTPDSISLYLPVENRLFTGDLIYPGNIYLYLPGSSLVDFEESLGKLKELHEQKPEGLLLSCGHMTPNLPAERLQELHDILPSIRARTARPQLTRSHAVFRTATFALTCRIDDVA